nr:hypothetical protein [Tanacetum cinerariifolium]
DLFQDFYDEYFDSSKIMKSSTMNVETSNAEIPSHGEEVFHEVFESFQGESSSSSLNDDVQQSPEEEIINPDFEKIDSPFQQTSSLKPYVPNVILEKIIIDLEDEYVNLLEKEKVNLETIESLKSKGFESSETVCSESENQSENDRLVVEKKCDKEENPKMNDLLDDNNFFIFDDVNVRISPVSKMPFRKKPRDSMHHMKGNHVLLMNSVEKFLGMVRFGNNDFAVIAGYGEE